MYTRLHWHFGKDLPALPLLGDAVRDLQEGRTDTDAVHAIREYFSSIAKGEEYARRRRREFLDGEELLEMGRGLLRRDQLLAVLGSNKRCGGKQTLDRMATYLLEPGRDPQQAYAAAITLAAKCLEDHLLMQQWKAQRPDSSHV